MVGYIHRVIIHFKLKKNIKNLGNLNEHIRVSEPEENKILKYKKLLNKKRSIKESLKHLFFDFFDLESMRSLGVEKRNYDRFITKKHFIFLIFTFTIFYLFKILRGLFGFSISSNIILFPEYLYEEDYFGENSSISFIVINIVFYIIMYSLIIWFFYNNLIYDLYISKIKVEDNVLIRIIKALNKFNFVLFVLSFNYVLLSCMYFFYIIDIYEKVILFEHMLDSTLYITDKIKEKLSNDIKLKKSINRITTINIILNYLFLASAFLITLIYHLMVYMINPDIYIVDVIKVYSILFLIALSLISILMYHIINRKRKIMGNF
ncbi:MAG: hypothetical protein ACTSRP_27885 [Candidatus Helarchaeota archaeon]